MSVVSSLFARFPLRSERARQDTPLLAPGGRTLFSPARWFNRWIEDRLTVAIGVWWCFVGEDAARRVLTDHDKARSEMFTAALRPRAPERQSAEVVHLSEVPRRAAAAEQPNAANDQDPASPTPTSPDAA